MASKDSADHQSDDQLHFVHEMLGTCKGSKGGPFDEYVEEFKNRCAEAKGKGAGFSNLKLKPNFYLQI